MYNKVKKILYYISKSKDDLTNPLIYNVKNQYCEKLGEYYFLFNKNELLSGGSYEFEFDKNNIPIVKGHISDTDGSFIYQPQAIGQFALSLYNEYIQTNDTYILNEFLNIADWFVENYKINQGIPYWENTVKKVINVYGVDFRNHIISSMSQSRAISVLLRAYESTGNESYLELVKKAINAYKRTPENGGFLDYDENGIYFEEKSQPRILNHLIFSIWGLNDYCKIIKNNDCSELLNKSINTIKNILQDYDYKWWSIYDNYYIDDFRRINLCTRHYHHIHIQQLYVMYRITNDNEFLKYYKTWSGYDKSIVNRLKMLLLKFKTVKEMGRL